MKKIIEDDIPNTTNALSETKMDSICFRNVSGI